MNELFLKRQNKPTEQMANIKTNINILTYLPNVYQNKHNNVNDVERRDNQKTNSNKQQSKQTVNDHRNSNRHFSCPSFHLEHYEMRTFVKKSHLHIHYPYQRYLLLQFFFFLFFTVTAISAESITSTNLLRRVVRGHDQLDSGDYDQFGPTIGADESHYSQEYSALRQLTSALKRIFPVISERAQKSLQEDRTLLTTRAKNHFDFNEDENLEQDMNDHHTADHNQKRDDTFRNSENNIRMDVTVKRDNKSQPEQAKRDTMLVDLQTLREIARLSSQRQKMHKIAQQQQQQQQQQRDQAFMRMLLRKLKNRGKTISTNGHRMNEYASSSSNNSSGKGVNKGASKGLSKGVVVASSSSSSLSERSNDEIDRTSNRKSDAINNQNESENYSQRKFFSSNSSRQQEQQKQYQEAKQQQYHQQQQQYHQFDHHGRFEQETEMDHVGTATPSTLGKRGPECMRRCILQGLLHPVQCHSLC